MKLLAACALVLVASPRPQEAPVPAEPTEQHRWLQQLVGEWEIDPDADETAAAMEMKGRETVRALGELWVIGEAEAEFTGGSFQSRITLGYDPVKEAFVGTWVDSIQTHLWIYEGHLDESGKRLVLEAEGPSLFDSAETANYRDTITLPDENTRLLTSSVQGEDGEWTEFMSVTYRRQAQAEDTGAAGDGGGRKP